MTWGDYRDFTGEFPQEEATVAVGSSGFNATVITDLVFVVVPVAATCIAIWSKGTLSADQITAAWTLSLGYAAGRPVKS